MTSAPCLGEGRAAQECRRGLSGGGRPGSWRQPQFFVFFFPPKSQLARSLSLGDFMCQTACLPTPGQHRAETRLPGVRVSANRSARVWGHVRGRRGCPGEVEGRLPLEPPGLQVESEDLWLSVCLPLPVAAAPFSLPSSRLSLPHQLLPLLICSAVPAASPGGWRMQVTCPELPSQVGLGLRCLHFGTSRVAMATWGAQHLPLSLGWAHGAVGMIHVYGDHMSSLCLTLKGWSLWGLG